MEKLIYDREYFCFFKNEYLGSATFTDDPFIGDSFIKLEVHKNRGLQEIAIMPDRWILKAE